MNSATPTRASPGRVASFAASKFLAPTPATRHVGRPSLRARLEDGDDGVRLVVGSPGSGKTSLLSEWFHELPVDQRCWVNVDDGDRDAVRFWTAFVTAVRGCQPEFAAGTLDLLRLDARVDHELLESLLDEVAQLDAPLTIVLDDFQLAGADVHLHLGFLLGRGTAPLRIVIGTRVEPDIGLHRLRLDRRLCEVREADLRFGQADAARLLERLGVSLTPDSLAIVLQRTEGWAAGLHLAALALHNVKEPADVVERLTGTNQVIAHYLWAEVFAAQPKNVQRFLLDTCVVDELSPALASALSPGNPITLLDIEAANLLLRRVDPAGTTFRYHQLLTEMLRFRLRATDAPHEIALHERAGRWHEVDGDPVMAFRHLWRAGQRTEALRALHGTVLDVVHDTVSAMSDAERSLTDDDIRAAPAPAASFAIALLTNGLPVEADRLARRVHAIAGHALDADETRQLRAVRAMVSVALGDPIAAIACGEPFTAGEPATDAWSVLIRCTVARAHAWELEHAQAADWLRNLQPPYSTPLEPFEVKGSAAQRELFVGDLTASDATVTTILADLDDDGSDGLRDGLLAQAIRGTLLLERGDLPAAERALRAVTATRSRFRVPAMVIADVALSRLWATEGHADAALVVLDDAYHAIPARPPHSGMLDRVREQHARVLIATGALDDADALRGDLRLERRRDLIAAEIALARDDLDQARRYLRRFDEARPPSRREQLESAIGWLNVDLTAGRPTPALASTVLDLATREGHVFPLVEAGSDALAAVQQLARQRVRTPHLEILMRQRPRAAPGPPREQRIDVLTERERVVLRCLATSMSYGEIADTLGVSLNTIKTHVKNINRKLDAHSRDDAIDRARQLHYL